MCGQNSFCNMPDGLCSCSVYPMPLNPNHIVSMLFSMIQSKSQVLIELNQQINEISSRLDQYQSGKKSQMVSNNSEISTSNAIQKLLSTEPSYKYKLKFLIEPPSVLYKERNFLFKCFAEDSRGQKLKFDKNMRFCLILYSIESPPVELVLNTSGDKIIRWTCAVTENCIEFRKVCINEVSSHYRQSVFCLAIKCLDECGIEPLVLSDVIVKARKIKGKDF